MLAELAAKRWPAACRDPGDVHYLMHEERAPRTRGAALHPVGRLAQEPETTGSSTPTSSTSRRRPRWPPISADYPEAVRAATPRDRRALQHRAHALARSCCRSSRCPRGETPSTTWSSFARKGLQKRYESVTPELDRAVALRAEDDQGDGLRRLLPDRLGLHRLREAERRLGRAGGAARRPGRSRAYCLEITDVDPIRYDLLFERFLKPGPQVDAGHGHRLRGCRPATG